MNLYKISRTDDTRNKWDIYLEAVVAAPDEETARNMYPEEIDPRRRQADCYYNEWVDNSKDVCVELIGISNTDKQQVISASYKAG